MCLILIRQPNVVLDYKEFVTCVDNNPHGWGISVPDGEGSLFTYRQAADGVDTNPEHLYEYIHDEFKSDKIMLHLRYTTAGETVLRNAHPFPILEKSKDGADLRMAHNGTLFEYEPGYRAPNRWESDTRVFTRSFVRPLMKRLCIGRSVGDVLDDYFTHNILDTQLTSQSVLTFIDGSGNTLIVNESGNGGFTADDGTYYSNKYSFNPAHRKPKYGVASSPAGKTGASTQSTKTNSGTTTNSSTTAFTSCNVQKFSEKHEFKDLDDLYLLSDESIEMLVEEEPQDAVLLIKELLHNLYKVDKKHQRASKIIARKAKLIKDLEENRKEGDTYGKAA